MPSRRLAGRRRVVALLAAFWHLGNVNAVAIPQNASVETSVAATMATQKLLRTWIGLCNEFRQRERREIIERVPSPKRLAEHREELKWMIRGARALLNVVSDPDFPARQFVAELSGKLLQLEDSWQSLNNPMTGSQADAILQKAFPDETQAGGPA